jgi:D-beta-D-heptose 7-phosphate kinase / D-beta-D-heptose 1-phosphate adenosyltransferase
MRTLIPRIRKFSEASIFVIGDVMLDVYVFGAVNRISPEAPVPILKVESINEMLGGAGNVVRNLKALGCNVHFASVSGCDGNAGKIRQLIEKEVTNNYRMLTMDAPAIVKTRYVANNHQILRTDIERKVSLTKHHEDTILEYLLSVLGDIQLIVMSDYNKGTLTQTLTRQIIAVARQKGIPVFVDPKGSNYLKYQGATLIKPNVEELKELFRLAEDSLDGSNELGYLTQLTEIVASEFTLLTRGSRGMILYDGKNSVEIPSIKMEVFDVSGAGDSVMATIAAAYSTGTSVEDAARLGNVAGGIVVGKSGTAVITQDELIQELHMSRNIFALPALLDMVALWRRNNYEIGFTNGCFDLLHQGHISVLKFAKSKCDKLIVALNSDRSVKALKGDSRPIKNEAERAVIMSEFNFVDAVIVFEEQTPESLITQLKPDVLVKGGDYSSSDVVGSSYVRSYGGQVLTSDYLHGHSSTRMVELISKA